MSQGPLRLSIVVPTFNEVDNVMELVQRLDRALAAISWEVIFVDDDSPDGTAAAVRQLARSDLRVGCVQRIGRRGLSTACIEGMLATSAPHVAVMDADLQHDEKVLPLMLAAAERGADIVVATRYADGGGVGDWAPVRARMSRLATLLGNHVIRNKTSDPMSGFFLVSRPVFDGAVRGLSGIGFKILLDLLATVKVPVKMAEVPYTFRSRLHGVSKLDESIVWDYGMLLADKAFGRIVPVRFVSFMIVGGLGVVVHLSVLAPLVRFSALPFAYAQLLATLTAMVFNFSLNNVLTYRDRRLRGLSWVKGLIGFMLVCGIGAAANVGVANYLHEGRTQWAVAALAGVVVGATWNFVATRFYTWKPARG